MVASLLAAALTLVPLSSDSTESSVVVMIEAGEGYVEAPAFAVAPLGAALAPASPDCATTGPVIWWWLARAVLGRGALTRAAAGAAGRAALRRGMVRSSRNLGRLSRNSRLSGRTRRTLRSVGAMYDIASVTLGDQRLSHSDAIRQLYRDLGATDGRVDALDRRLAEAEREIYELERRQGRILREIADLRLEFRLVSDRVTALEGRVVTLEGRVVRNEQEIEAIKRRMEREDGRYDRHVASVAVSGYYSNFTASGSAGGLGGGVTAIYNFDERFGSFATLAALPVEPGSAPTYDDEVWDSFVLAMGGLVNVLPPRYASLRLKVGVGVVRHQLSYANPGDPFSREGTIDGETNAALLVGTEFGFAPPLFPVELFAEASIAALATPLRDDAFFREPGTALVFGGVGIRFPFTPRVR